MKNSKGHGRNARIVDCLCGHTPVPFAIGLCKSCYMSQKNRRSQYKRDSGITVADYELMLANQGGVCKICSKTQKSKRLAVDHCHKTGKIRGLLCGPCNTALSHIEHTSPFALKALKYLENNF